MDKITWLGLSVTDFCNLNCVYCAVDARSKGIAADFDIIQKFFDYFSPYAGTATMVSITGGEPTLHPRIVDIVKYAEEHLIDPNIIILSNGIIPKKTFDALLSETKAMFQISFEGLPEIHDSERFDSSGNPSSSGVIKTMKAVVAHDPSRLRVRVNYSPKKFGKEDKIADFLTSLGVQRISQGVLFGVGRGKDYKDIDYFESLKGWPIFIKAMRKKGLTLNVNTKEMLEWLPCGAGTRSFFLTVDGKVAVCQNIVNAEKIPEVAKILVVGDIKGGVHIDKEKLSKVMEFSEEVPAACAACDVKTFCNHCPYEKALAGGVFSKEFCKNTKCRLCSLANHGLIDHAKLKKACE
ncbi:MAG: radical SAM protein [Candidatus Altiarchaeota archaeon]|nr:radical SAM protein [Candidatus Altiarchaeota archaeon]